MFYTYLWLRENGLPFYVGKGMGQRAYRKGCPPKERIILQYWDSEEQALEAEKFLIAVYGRKDIGTGCLINLTDGGDIPPNRRGTKMPIDVVKRIQEKRKGYRHSDETRLKIGLSNKRQRGAKRSAEHCTAISQGLQGNKYTLGRIMPEHEKAAKRNYRHTEEARAKITAASRAYWAERKLPGRTSAPKGRPETPPNVDGIARDVTYD